MLAAIRSSYIVDGQVNNAVGNGEINDGLVSEFVFESCMSLHGEYNAPYLIF